MDIGFDFFGRVLVDTVCFGIPWLAERRFFDLIVMFKNGAKLKTLNLLLTLKPIQIEKRITPTGKQVIFRPYL
jgi:hypothetical protein